jgi:hypothetical protein
MCYARGERPGNEVLEKIGKVRTLLKSLEAIDANIDLGAVEKKHDDWEVMESEEEKVEEMSDTNEKEEGIPIEQPSSSSDEDTPAPHIVYEKPEIEQFEVFSHESLELGDLEDMLDSTPALEKGDTGAADKVSKVLGKVNSKQAKTMK